MRLKQQILRSLMLSYHPAYEVESQHAHKIRRQIKLIVLFLHALLFWFVAHTAVKAIQPHPKKIVVRTVKLTPQKPVKQELPKQEFPKQELPVAPSTPPPSPPPPAVVEQKAPPAPVVVEIPAVPKPTTKPKPKVVKKIVPKPKAPPKKTAPPKVDKVQSEKIKQQKLEEKRKSDSIASAIASLNRSGSVEQKKATVSAKGAIAVPQAIGALSSDSLVAVVTDDEPLTGQERSYRDELIRRLQLALRLPEYADVTLQLTISRLGKMVALKSLKSSSKKNKSYVEKTLPTVHFPAFGQNFSNEKEHTFQLRLTKSL